MKDFIKVKKLWSNFPKVKAEDSAFYSMSYEDGVYFVSMYYHKENALEDSRITNGKLISLKKLLRMCGTGKTLLFRNFYLS